MRYRLPEPLAVIPGTEPLLRQFIARHGRLEVVWVKDGRACATFLCVPDAAAMAAETELLPAIAVGAAGPATWTRVEEIATLLSWTMGAWLDPYAGAQILSLINVESALLSLTWTRLGCRGTLLYGAGDAAFCGDLVRAGWGIRPLTRDNVLKRDRGPTWLSDLAPTVTAALPRYVRRPDVQAPALAEEPTPAPEELPPGVLPPLPPARPHEPLPPRAAEDVTGRFREPLTADEGATDTHEPVTPRPTAPQGFTEDDLFEPEGSAPERADDGEELAVKEQAVADALAQLVAALQQRAAAPTHPAAAAIIAGWEAGVARHAPVKQLCGWGCSHELTGS